MVYISRSLRKRIAEAAGFRCGYCQTRQDLSGAQLQIEHLLPSALGGTSDEENLWLSCALCNSYKGTKTTAVDPETDSIVPLFNPRSQVWEDHFSWSSDGTEIIGRTPAGRATVLALNLNNPYVVPARRQWVLAGWHPSKGA